MSKAERWVESPTKDVQKQVDEVQEIANQTQGPATRYIDAGDGSQLEVTAAPEVAYEGDEPTGPDVPGRLWRDKDGVVRRASQFEPGGPVQWEVVDFDAMKQAAGLRAITPDE